MSAVINAECPICMDPIEGLCNRVVTECGHVFHCSCLMQNAAHNGFGCPYCRSVLATEPEEDDDEYDDEDSIEVFPFDALTSFRMFHQRVEGEEVEEEVEEDDDWETVASDEEDEQKPDIAYICQKLIERGITFEDMVKTELYHEHHCPEHENKASVVYGQFRAVISQYRPQEPQTQEPQTHEPETQEPETHEPESQAMAIAEAKPVAIPRRREVRFNI